MIPYLILQMLVLIVTIALGGLISAVYFLLAPNMEENQIGGGIVLGKTFTTVLRLKCQIMS